MCGLLMIRVAMSLCLRNADNVVCLFTHVIIIGWMRRELAGSSAASLLAMTYNLVEAGPMQFVSVLFGTPSSSARARALLRSLCVKPYLDVFL